jgi:hypothetical protein
MKETMYKEPRGPKRFLRFLLFAATAMLVLGGIVMLLWNTILPALFHVPVIGYWQAVGLLLLCKILFSSFPPGPGNRRSFLSGPPPHIQEKFMKMNEEEKATFKEQWKKRCAKRKE